MNNLLQKISPEVIKAYQNHLAESGVSPATAKRRNVSLRKFYEWTKGLSSRSGIESNNDPGSSNRRIGLSRSEMGSIHPGGARAHPPGDKFKWFRFAILAILILLLGFGGLFAFKRYNKSITNVSNTNIITGSSQMTRYKRQLAFSGLLTDKSGNPITQTATVVFRILDRAQNGNILWSSEDCQIKPTADGAFSTLLGSSCGKKIDGAVFGENFETWIEMTVAADGKKETLSPRVQVPNVSYAVNADSLQGYHASTSAIASTIPVLNEKGALILASSSPSIYSTSGTFGIKAQELSITTDTGTNGDITIAPDGTGQVIIRSDNQKESTLKIENAQITSGSLISGYVANNNTNYDLINLSAGTNKETKFAVDALGNIISAAGSVWMPATNSTDKLGIATANGTPFVQFDPVNQSVGIGGEPTNRRLEVNGETGITGNIYNLYGKAIKQGREGIIYESGWYRIAQTAGDRASALFNIMDMTADRNQSVFFYASAAYPDSNNRRQLSVNILSNVRHDINTFDKIRIIRKSANDPAYLEVYIDGASNNIVRYIISENDWESGWQPVSWEKGSVPSGYTFVEYKTTNISFGVNENSLLVNEEGDVGIGTGSPAYRLDVNGNTRIAGDLHLSNAFYDSLDSFGANSQVLSTTQTGTDWIDLPSGYAGWYLAGDTGASQTISSGDTATFTGGNGLITTTTTGTNDSLNVSVGAGSGISVADDSVGINQAYNFAWTGKHTWNNTTTIDASGNVGIGLTNPSTNLHISGDMRLTGAYYDVNNEVGTYGQVLTTAGTGTDWTDITAIGIGGSGRIGYLPKFTAPTSLGLSQLYESGDNVGIGTTMPYFALTVGENITDVFPAVPAIAIGNSDGSSLISMGTNSDNYLSLNWDYDNQAATILSTKHLAMQKGQDVLGSAVRNVGIGTLTPTAKLEVNPNVGIDASVDIYTVIKGGASITKTNLFGPSPTLTDYYGLYLAAPTLTNVSITNKYALVTEEDAGNVGIGTTAPTENLHIVGDMRLTGGFYDSNNTAGSANQILSSTGTGTTWLDITSVGIGGSGSINYIPKFSAGTTLGNSLLYDSGTGVGIGTTAPGFELEIGSTETGAKQLVITNVDSEATSYAEFAARNGTTANLADAFRTLTMGSGYTTIGGFVNDSAVLDAESGLSGGLSIMTRANAPIRFYTNGYDQERMRITEGGSLGIGTTAPAYALDVNGSLGVSNTAYFSSSIGVEGKIYDITDSFLTIDDDLKITGADILNSTGDSVITFDYAGATKLVTISGDLTVSGGDLNFVSAGLHNIETNKLGLSTNSTIRVAIDSSGNVGIGTTAPTENLHIVGDMRLTGGFYDSNNTAGSANQILSSTGTGTTWLDITSVGIGGSGSVNYVSKFTGAKTLGNSLIYDDGTNVGIGTTDPVAKLDVTDTVAASVSAMITNLSGTTTADVLAVKVGTTAPNAENYFVSFMDGIGRIVGKIQGVADGNGVNYATTGTDLAEYFKIENPNETFERGDLICNGNNGVVKCVQPNNNIVGVFSETAAFTGGINHEDDVLYTIVGLIGQLPLKVSTANGPIAGGDPLTTSNIPGVAVKAISAAPIVGRAMESYSGNEIGIIWTYTNPTWYEPPAHFGDLIVHEDVESASVTANHGSFGQLLADSISAENASISGELVVNEITANHAQMQTLDVAGTIYADEIITKSGTFGELIAQKIQSNSIEPAQLASIEGKLAMLEERMNNLPAAPSITPIPPISPIPTPASEEATTPVPDPGTLTDEQVDLLADQIIGGSGDTGSWAPSDPVSFVSLENYNDLSIIISKDLTVNGNTMLANVGVSSTLSIGGTLQIADNSINNVGGILYIQNLGRGGIDILAGKITINENGNAVFEGDVEIKGALYAGEAKFNKLIIASDSQATVSAQFNEIITNATAGEAILTANETEITIKSPFVTDNSLIYITPSTGTQNKVLYIAGKQSAAAPDKNTSGVSPGSSEVSEVETPGWFKVALDSPIESDIKFSWWIIN